MLLYLSSVSPIRLQQIHKTEVGGGGSIMTTNLKGYPFHRGQIYTPYIKQMLLDFHHALIVLSGTAIIKIRS